MANSKPKQPDLKQCVNSLNPSDTIEKLVYRIPSDGEHEQPTFNAKSSASESVSSDVVCRNAVSSGMINYCAICKSPAKVCCTACSNIPMLTRSDLKRTYYCSSTCQRIDWPRHKLLCKTFRSLLDRLSLSRAADFLQQVFYAYREAAFDLSIKRLDIKDKVATFYEGDYKDTCILPGFPHELVKDKEPWIKNMMLTMLACTDMFVQIEEVCAFLLKDTRFVTKIEEMTFVARSKAAPRQWVFVRHQGRWTPDEWSHNAYRITLRDNSIWALDLTAAQFGYEDSLVPWQQYERERIIHFLKVEEFGEMSARYERKFSLSPGFGTIFTDGMSKIIFQAQREIGKTMEVSLAIAFKMMGLTADKFLGSPNNEFTRRSEAIIRAGKVRMEAFKKEKKAEVEKKKAVMIANGIFPNITR